MLPNLKDLYQLKQQASQIQAKLADEKITAETNGIKITMNGNQQVLEVIINSNLPTEDQQKYLREVFNDCINKIQQLMAKQMMGQL